MTPSEGGETDGGVTGAGLSRVAVGIRTSPHRVVDEQGVARPYRRQANLPDQVAVEAALRTAEEVVAIGVGGEAVGDAIRTALSMGADRGVHVAYDPIEEAIPEKWATVLARAAAREDVDALLVGESAPLMSGEVVTHAADTLGWPAVTQVTAIGDDVEGEYDLETDETALQRKLAVGRQEAVATSFPAVLSVHAGYANPRRGSLATAMQGRRTTVEQTALETIAPAEGRFSMSVGRVSVETIQPNTFWGRGDPPRGGGVEERIARMLGRGSTDDRSAGELVDAPPEEAADRVVEFLDANNLL
jgi:electron transfer flavoprotein beta subunit